MLQIQQALFSDMDANLYAISTDPPKRHQQLAAYYKLQFPLLSDPNHDVLERTGMYDTETLRAHRGFALLAPDGSLLTAHKNDKWGEEIQQTSSMLHKAYETWKHNGQTSLETSFATLWN